MSKDSRDGKDVKAETKAEAKAGAKAEVKAEAKAARKREEDWTTGFRTGARKGMTCDQCRCLVRQNPGDADAHRRWHASLER